MRLRFLYFLFRIYSFFFRPVRLGVRIMMVEDGQVLLVRQTYLPGWFMPGGGLKRGETLEGAARREVREETGAEVASLQLLGVYTNFSDWKTDHNALFVTRDFKVSGVPDSEIAELRFFPLDALPADLWPGHRLRLEELWAGAAHPQFGEW